MLTDERNNGLMPKPIKQRVYLARSLNGVPGLFTNGILVFGLSEQRYEKYLKLGRLELQLVVENLGYELIQPAKEDEEPSQ